MKTEHLVLQNTLESIVENLDRFIADATFHCTSSEEILEKLAAYKDSLHRIAEGIK